MEANEGLSPSEEEELGGGGSHLTRAWEAWSPQPAHVAMQPCARHIVCDIMWNVCPKGLKDFPWDSSRTKPAIMSGESPAPNLVVYLQVPPACHPLGSPAAGSPPGSGTVRPGNHLCPCQQRFCTQHK